MKESTHTTSPTLNFHQKSERPIFNTIAVIAGQKPGQLTFVLYIFAAPILGLRLSHEATAKRPRLARHISRRLTHPPLPSPTAHFTARPLSPRQELLLRQQLEKPVPPAHSTPLLTELLWKTPVFADDRGLHVYSAIPRTPPFIILCKNIAVL